MNLSKICFQSTRKANKRSKHQQGLSLIEASMVLALSAVVVAGVMYYYQAASDNNKLQAADSELMSIVSGVDALYASQPNYNAIATSVVATSASVPQNYVGPDGKTINNPFNGQINIAPTESGSVPGVKDEYQITMDSIPKDSCVSLASESLGTSMVSIEVASSAGGKASFKKVNPPYTPDEGATLCTSTDNANQIRWTMK